MIIRLLSFFIFTTSLFIPQHISGQDMTQRDYYNWFDTQTGIENTGLFNGVRYKELYRIKNGKHKFYERSDFFVSQLVYDGQPYYDVNLKYDLYEDQMIAEIQAESGSSILKLIKDLVESFRIEEKTFVHLKGTEVYKSKEQIDGFYEILKEGQSLFLYKKHSKIINKVLDNSAILYEFKSDNKYYVFHNDLFYPVSNKNDLIKIFPERKKQINEFYSGNKYLMKSNYDLFMIQIAERIDAALTSKSSQS